MQFTDQDIPVYSNDGLASRDIFYSEFNEFLFYFEDARYEAVYERFIQKIFPKLGKVDVQCLGGKSEVLKKAKEPELKGTVRICVLDKDFDDLVGRVESHKSIVYFDRYCFENFMLDWPSLKRIVIEELEGEATEIILNEQTADFEDYWNMLFTQYEKLTRLFVVARRYSVTGIETTKSKVEKYLDLDDGIPYPTNAAIEDYRVHLMKNCTADQNAWLNDNNILDQQLEDAFNPWMGRPLLTTVCTQHFCGKHLLDCLLYYVKLRANARVNEMPRRKLFLRMLSILDNERFNEVRERMLNVAPAIPN